jgi:hypothetical protein
MNDENVNCIVARCKCGSGFCYMAVDQPEYRNGIAKEVAKLIRDGYRIENITVGEARKSKLCWCESPAKKAKPAATAELF